MTTRPNIVFLLADDLGYGDFSAFNNGLSSTPTLDGLIREGTCLTQHYSASPVCDCNAAIRDGDWKLVRPWRDRCGDVPDNQWNHISMYGPEHFIHNGIFQPPYPTVQLGPTQPPLLFNIRNDPHERNDMAAADPDRVARLGHALDQWFEDVERDRRSITDTVPPPRIPRPVGWNVMGRETQKRVDDYSDDYGSRVDRVPNRPPKWTRKRNSEPSRSKYA